MQLSQQVAKHFREVYFGGNWTSVNLKDELIGLSWQEATLSVHASNSIAALVFHMNYFVSAVLNVMKGGQLDAHDKFSFDLPPVTSQSDWEQLLEKTFADAAEFAKLAEQMPDERLLKDFAGSKYGSYFRNILGIIEHNHYHLGQIVILKKIILENRVTAEE